MSRAWLQTRPIRLELVCFPVVALAYGLHFLLSGYNRFYFDASDYWDQGKRFEHNGHFSLLAYDGQFRGYALPLLNHVLQVVASGLGLGAVTIVKIFGAFLAATLGVVVVPRLARVLFPAAAIGAGRVLALNALIFVYWRDHFDFPLSDFPALLAASIGLLGLFRGTTRGYLLAGLGFGLAANVRPAYLPAAVACVGVAAFLPPGSPGWRRRGLAATLVVAGALVASLPQVLINEHQRGNWSPLVPNGRSISLLQLSQGMHDQKYETYVGPLTRYPQPDVFYIDPATTHVLKQEHIFQSVIVFGLYAEITSYGQYARIVFHHPAEMAASYVRHIFNGLDVQYPTPYVRDLGDRSIVFALLEYTLMFLAIARTLLPDARRALGRIRWAGIVLLLATCLTAVPGAVEPRFFLPVQLLIYMLVCFSPTTHTSLLGGGIGRRAGLFVSYVAFVLLCLTLSSATLAQLEHPGPTLGLGNMGKSPASPTALSRTGYAKACPT
jgi:hypothetical protein